MSENFERLSSALFRLFFSAESISAMSPVTEFRLPSVPAMLSALVSIRPFRFSSVRERSVVSCETFCLKKSSSEPAMSNRSRSRLERSVSPFCMHDCP